MENKRAGPKSKPQGCKIVFFVCLLNIEAHTDMQQRCSKAKMNSDSLSFEFLASATADLRCFKDSLLYLIRTDGINTERQHSAEQQPRRSSEPPACFHFGPTSRNSCLHTDRGDIKVQTRDPKHTDELSAYILFNLATGGTKTQLPALANLS